MCFDSKARQIGDAGSSLAGKDSTQHRVRPLLSVDPRLISLNIQFRGPADIVQRRRP